MALEPIVIKKPQRWDVPFGVAMTEADVENLLTVPPFSQIDPTKFPAAMPLRGILLNDARLVRYQNGDIIVRRGDYGNSAFFILSGTARVELDPLPAAVLGRQKTQRKGFFQAIAQLWSNHRQPEVRDSARYRSDSGVAQRGRGDEVHVFLQDMPAILDKYQTARLEAGQMFGELAALGRTPRTATVFAEGDVLVLEIRWQGLRDLMRRDETLKQHIDRIFRERALVSFLRGSPVFQHLDTEALAAIALQTQFEAHGHYDKAGSFKDMAAESGGSNLEQEPVIVEEGDYPNGLLMVRSGLVRLSRHVNHGHRTLNYLVPGQTYGFEELSHNWKSQDRIPLPYTLRAVGYVNVVLVPTHIIEEYVLSRTPAGKISLPMAAPAPSLKAERATPRRGEIDTDLLEFLVEKRYINGTASMVIDLDRCTRCDDCVRACAAAHDNNPRFLRYGAAHGHHMVANACMHCLDPVCMIECPTGAIHRDPRAGVVVINDRTCIGCSACAKNCPFDAIRMVEIRDQSGNLILDQNSNKPIAKATKCDLCNDQLTGPACQRACPHDALIRVDMRDSKTLSNWLNR